MLLIQVAAFWMVIAPAQTKRVNQPPVIPKTWDDKAMNTLEIPLANPVGSPKAVPAAYYYQIPLRPIYKQYPVYAPDREPAGYMDRLKQLEPIILWDGGVRHPKLDTEEDFVKAGSLVFEASVFFNGDVGPVFNLSDVRNKTWWRKSGMPVNSKGIMPFMFYVVREKGKVELGTFSCAMCHTRIMSDGKVVNGAQGNIPFGAALAQSSPVPPPLNRALYSVPWLHPDPIEEVVTMNDREQRQLSAAIPAGVNARHRTSLVNPVQIPDLIGVKQRRYLDRTGLQPQNAPVDFMRYVAMNQGGDSLSSFGGFVPVGLNFKTPPDPTDSITVGGRYSDEELYALTQYVYSLKPPPNPNKPSRLTLRGKQLFVSEGCARCHSLPSYSNNRLTPTVGFDVPSDHRFKYDIMKTSVGTDSGLTMKTRRGTGYYKVPSLRGLWYRSMFGHSGWCANLEDWFDPRRLEPDYVPTGFRPNGNKPFPVLGHAYGLDLSADDRKALISFLKTL
ncbi:hypothetical protein HDF16_005221 [Granulicella aggregans]|uniref:Cytochrome c domain-containing protein n=1 Tax=Granulicella aggregans TaxID=474949 RepID=A0A7W8E7P5_9BACT|nr:hypothetical protein [Granulicella aggregans]